MAHPQATRRYAMTDLKAHEAWGEFSARQPRAASVLHYLVARAGRYGSVTVSHAVLAEICGVGTRTVKRALSTLEKERWIQIVRLGSERGGVNCYVIDKGVCWADVREKMGYVTFETRVLAAAHEQPEDQLEHDGELQTLPSVAPGEEAIPSGPGEPPPSQPSLEGLEPYIYREQSTGQLYEHNPETGELQQLIDDGDRK